MSDLTIAAPLRARRRRPLTGAIPPTRRGTDKPHGRPTAKMPKYPIRAKLSPLEGDVLALLHGPRGVFEVAEALGIESPTARWALDSLVGRQLAVEAGSYPTIWEAT